MLGGFFFFFEEPDFPALWRRISGLLLLGRAVKHRRHWWHALCCGFSFEIFITHFGGRSSALVSSLIEAHGMIVLMSRAALWVTLKGFSHNYCQTGRTCVTSLIPSKQREIQYNFNPNNHKKRRLKAKSLWRCMVNTCDPAFTGVNHLQRHYRLI